MSSLKIRKSVADYLFESINGFFLVMLTLATLYPFLYVVFISLSKPEAMVGYRGLMLGPRGFSLTSYRRVFLNPMIRIGYMNTLFYVIVGTTINIFLTSLGAYALSRRNLYFKNILTIFIVFTMFFSGGIIPLYLVVKSLGLVNTRWALILPPAISSWNLIIMRTGFYAVPYSLEESAKIDGANDFYILFRIYIPLSMAVVAVMILFYGVSHWNSYFEALIYLRDRSLYPVQLVLREILILSVMQEMATDAGAAEQEPLGETIKHAVIIVTTLPILMLYPLLQRHFVKGVKIGALKG